ncbi:MAG: hypothetical protein ACK4PI_03225 [Tepidisphaerales bacterium]
MTAGFPRYSSAGGGRIGAGRRLVLVLVAAGQLAGPVAAVPSAVSRAAVQPVPGPDPAVIDSAVDRAVRFLARRQVPPQSPDPALAGAFVAERDLLTVTALTVLALLSAAHTEDDGRYGLTLLRAGDWLSAELSGERPGQQGGDTDTDVRGQAMAVLALAELAAQAFEADRRDRYLGALRLAAERLRSARLPPGAGDGAGAWPTRRGERGDLIATAWSALALNIAHQLTATGDDPGLADAAAFAQRCLSRDSDNIAFAEHPGGPVSPSATAGGVLIAAISRDAGLAAVRLRAADEMARSPVRGDDPAVYTAVWLSVLAARYSDAAGSDADDAPVGRRVLAWAIPLLLSLQQDDGGFALPRGTPDPGRVHATALAVLALTADRGVLLAHLPLPRLR